MTTTERRLLATAGRVALAALLVGCARTSGDGPLGVDGGGSGRDASSDARPRADADDPTADLGPHVDGATGTPDLGRGPDGGEPVSDASALDPDLGRAADGAPAQPDAAPPPPVALDTRRSCTVTLRHLAPGAGSVRFASELTEWEVRARPFEGPDPNGLFTLTLGPEDGLVPGTTSAYKLIVDGGWRLDPEQTRQKFVGGCVNSAVLAPACDAGPELVVEDVESRPDGRLQATFRLEAATTGDPRGSVVVHLDGDRVEPEDLGGGRFRVDRAGLEPGKHRLSLRGVDADGREAQPVDLPLWREAAPFQWSAASLYLLLVDRFANGDRGNDAPVGPPVAYPADWHGGDLQGATRVLESGYFESLGVDVIWLSPTNEQTDGAFGGRDDASRMFAAYHGYWPVSGRDVEPRFGGGDALRAFVQAAHARGIRVLVDLINNQVHQEHAYFRAHPDWFRTACVCGIDPGCGWSERPLDCLFAPYLPDIDWRVPAAEAQFIDDAVAWVRDYDVDGFRVDAVKHVETTAVYNLRAELARRFEAGGARIVMLGETAVGEGDRFDDGCGERYADGYAWISAYTGRGALDGQFDFPSHHRLQDGLLTDRMGYDAVESVVRDLRARYASDALHVRFLGSHDSSRMASRAAQDPARDCRWSGGAPCDLLPGVPDDDATFARLRRAFAVLYTLPGIPLLYQGDEVATPGGNDPDNRRDMVFDADLGDVDMSVVALTPRQVELRTFVAALGRARATSEALRHGERTVLVAEADVYALSWQSGGAHALLVVNRGGRLEGRRVVVGAGWPALDVAAGQGAARIDGDAAVVTLAAGQVALFTSLDANGGR